MSLWDYLLMAAIILGATALLAVLGRDWSSECWENFDILARMAYNSIIGASD